MPKAKKIAPSPAAGAMPYRSFVPPPPGGSGDSSSSRGRQKARVYTPRACQNCQIKKIKCSGQPPPCQRCAGENIDCIFDRTTDQRRREASAKKEEENRKIRRCLEQLLELLGGTDEQALGRVREMVREGAEWSNIQDFLDLIKTRNPAEEKSPTEELAGSSAAESSIIAQERSVRTPVAFDEWIAEMFGTPEVQDDMTNFE